MQKQKQQSSQVSSFIRNVCEVASIKVVRITVPGPQRGRFGWVRVMVDGLGQRMLERSSTTFRSEGDAFTAAHKHYRLRSA